MAKAGFVTQAELTNFHRHGGRLDDAVVAFEGAPTPWLDLSTGINPRAWSPPQPLEVDSRPLPSVSALEGLESTAANFFGCDPALVVAVPGSEVALRLLGALNLPRPIVALAPSYGTHAEVADEIIQHSPIERSLIQAGTILLANPNNPDGLLHSRADLMALAAGLAGTAGALVVDEAFADVEPEHSMVTQLASGMPLTVLRSFGKFFGLAGVRLGFLIGHPDIVRRLRDLLGDWPVGAHAIAWGTAAYGDEAWIADTQLWLKEQAGRLDAVLARHGLSPRGACPLFRLIEHDDAPAVFERLARRGILTRPFAANPRWLRFGLPGDDAALDRLDRALGGG